MKSDYMRRTHTGADKVAEFYVSCLSDRGPTSRLILYADKFIDDMDSLPFDYPMYLAEGYGHIFILLKEYYPDGESGVIALRNDLRKVGEVLPTGGKGGCHISLACGKVYAANYASGTVSRVPDRVIQHEGHSVDPVRQTQPHPHSVFPTPDEKYILCCDLGLDKIFVYTPELELVSEVGMPAGAGPRHLCFSKCGKFVYCINEMGGSISSLSFEDGTLTLLHTVSILPEGFEGKGSGAAIKISFDGTRIYATERASRSIVTLAAEGAKLTVLARCDCHGREPRDFTLVGHGTFGVCTNQYSNNIAIFMIDEDGIPEFFCEYNMPAPLCAMDAPADA